MPIAAPPFPFHFSPFTFHASRHHHFSDPGRRLHRLDFLVVVCYFVFTLGVGLWVARRQRSATDYFLGARDLPAWAILLSIVATETSAVTVISVPGIGARGDLTFLQLAFGYLIGRIGVAVWLLPGYFRGEQETAYARLESRFGAPTRRLISVVFLVTRFLGDAVRVFASAIPLALVTGWSIPTSIVAMGLVTLVYTWFGGFKAVVWTDVLQLSVYLAGGIGALWIAGRSRAGRRPRSARRPARGSSSSSFPRSTSPAPTLSSAACSAVPCSRPRRTGPTISSCSGSSPPAPWPTRAGRSSGRG